MLNSFSKVAWCAAVVLVSASTSVLADDVSADSLRQQNLKNFESVRTVVLEERVQQERAVAVDARWVDGVSAIEETRKNLTDTAVATGAGEERLQKINDDMDGQYEVLEESIAIEKLNASTAVRRTTTIDRSKRRARRDDVDLRDLSRLGKENHLGSNQLKSLDRSCSLISIEGQPEIRLHTPRAGKLATVMPYKGFPLVQEELRLGLLPAYLFSASFSLEVRPTDTKQFLITARNRATGQKTFEATVAPEKGNLMTEFRSFNDEGSPIEVFTASDFRRVDGVWLPFETRSEFRSEPIAPTVIVRQVRNARINAAASDELFAPPTDYSVTDLSKTGPAAHEGADPIVD